MEQNLPLTDILYGDNPMYPDGYDGLDGITALMLLMHATQKNPTRFTYVITRVSISPHTMQVWIDMDGTVSTESVIEDITKQTGHTYNFV